MADQKKAVRNIEAVRLDRAGVRRCGPFMHGVTYKVGEEVEGHRLTLDEANRLVDHKGFTEVKAKTADVAPTGVTRAKK